MTENLENFTYSDNILIDKETINAKTFNNQCMIFHLIRHSTFVSSHGFLDFPKLLGFVELKNSKGFIRSPSFS